jgi:NADH-quinone oxidoreductase subunit M
MNPLSLPWLELAIALCAIGALWVSQLRDPDRAYQFTIAFTGLALVCTVLAWLGFYLQAPSGSRSDLSPQFALLGRPIFELDELGAPLVPAIALIHFLTAMATSRNRMRRFSGSLSLASESLLIALFSCSEPWLIIGLLAATTVPPFIELTSRGRSTRVFVIHMALFIGLLVIGWTAVEAGGIDSPPSAWATIPLLLAVLIRCGTVPAHCWVTDWFEHATFGIAILFVAPLGGVYTAVRLVLPIAPEWVLHSIALLSLATAVYAAGMATIQREVRRFYAQIFISLASLVLVGLELNTVMSLTGSFCLWFSVILSLTGFGLTGSRSQVSMVSTNTPLPSRHVSC